MAKATVDGPFMRWIKQRLLSTLDAPMICDAARGLIMDGLQEYMLEGSDLPKMIAVLNSFELEKDSTPATPTECFLFMLMMAIPGPEFAPGLAALLTEAITSGFLIKADVLAGMAAEMGFLAAIAALMEQKTSPHLPITCGQLLAPLVKSGLLSQDEMNAGLDKALAALPDDLDALKAEIASRAAA